MKKIEKTANQFVFEAEISETLANAIRRYVNRIPVMAVDEVEISKNDSALYDDMMRLLHTE
jgi:DNA-directed RNA polymerase alpha subunit